MKKSRLNTEKRRAAILAAAAPLFARHGYRGVTTRQLAVAAGVSEALLYRHFRSKQELYAATQHHHPLEADDLIPVDLPPSTERLVATLQRLAGLWSSPENRLAIRQLVHSLLDDGALARSYFKRLEAQLLPALRADLLAAHACGDLELPPEGVLEPWLAHHLLLGLQLTSLPERSPLDYHAPRFAVLQRCVRFALRGLGLSEAAISRACRAGSTAP